MSKIELVGRGCSLIVNPPMEGDRFTGSVHFYR